VILRRFVVGPFASNCYIVGSEAKKEGLVIDPGGDSKQILKEIKNLSLDIKLIVLTHAHIDHAGALKEVKETTEAGVAIHVDDAKSLRMLGHSLSAPIRLFYPAPPSADRLLEEGDSIDIGDLHFKVMHTPGHTPGGICLLGEGLVFTGDTLFNQSIGRTDLPGGSHSKLMKGIHSKLMALPDNIIVYPGHGPETTIGDERRSNPFLTE